MIHPDTELRPISPEVGFGIVATKRIPRGTITWALCLFDLVLTPEQARAMPEAYRPILAKYAYIDAAGRLILCWDNARYMNHSCEANSLGVGGDLEIAARDIEPGEQITGEYGTLNLPRDLECRCGASSCRGLIRRADMKRLGPHWDAVVRAALPQAAKVPQPLRPFLRDSAAFDDMIAGRRPVPQHADYHCEDPAPLEALR